ncbi:sterol desaturase family protein [Polaromonas sp.]|uniref:sterol desaturase family protein n=1 Tax=Polaromonas sp. TaxID=1869339 RepID=UPI003BB4A667
MDWLTGIFAGVQGWLFQALVQPALFALDMGSLFEDAYGATAWFMMGVIQIIILLAVIGPLQRWRPVEVMDSPADRASIRIDVLYTLLHRLGLFRLALFFTLQPWFDAAFGALRTAGYGTFHLDQLWPGVTDKAVVSLLIYLLVFDFVGYWTHRGQHRIEWWWRLHSLHHSQRQMTMWSDNRSHLLDSIVLDSIVVVVAQLIGVASDQFIVIVALTQLSESFQHANLRLWFGRIGERLWVSPRFHRLHHSIGIGHETNDPKTLGGHNFGVLLPWWDMLFGTANFEPRYEPTGVRDQIEKNRDYGSGFWSQQWLGMKRLFGRA